MVKTETGTFVTVPTNQVIAAARSQVQRRVKRKLADALIAGRQLSNIAFNLNQREAINSQERALLKECYEKWDRAIRALPKWMRDST